MRYVVEADGHPGHDHSKSHSTQDLLANDGTRQYRNRVNHRSLVSTRSEESNLDVSPGSVQGYSTDGDAFIAEDPKNQIVGSSA